MIESAAGPGPTAHSDSKIFDVLAMAKTSFRSAPITTSGPKSYGRNLGYGLRYKLGYSSSIAAEKHKSYQCTGGELVSSRPHHLKDIST
jgi:hypothetical protein